MLCSFGVVFTGVSFCFARNEAIWLVLLFDFYFYPLKKTIYSKAKSNSDESEQAVQKV
jgi:hypothetical protein